MLTEDSVVAVSDGLSVADLDGEAVILSSSTYFGLNEVGARAFELARRPRSIREIVATMLGEYAVDPDTLTVDLLRFFGAMQEARLVDTDPPQPAGG
jgi:hypothetical protein